MENAGPACRDKIAAKPLGRERESQTREKEKLPERSGKRRRTRVRDCGQ